MLEFSARAPGSPDGLFLERLETFMDKCLADIKAFSEREHRPFAETRQYVAEWHSRYLFDPPLTDGGNAQRDAPSKVLSTLYDASRLLESLCELTGVQSFVLAVDPNNPSDAGFLGGTVKGREFWRGLRGGGAHGAKAFKSYCLRDMEPSTLAANPVEGSLSSRAPSIASAKSLKTDLYDYVRTALRTVSGVRNAEMKWTNPERLDVYGVRLVGWPPTIPAQNPSSLKAGQNKHLIQCLENGSMRFEKIGSIDGSSCEVGEEETIPNESCDQEDFSWAYIEDGVDPGFDGNGRRQQKDSLSVPPRRASDRQHTNDGRASIAIVYQGSNDSTSVEPPSRKRPRYDSSELENAMDGLLRS